ncbi:Hypp6218 [Branchiostoma lanceolatum]|uniref:Hypp6218 protein n=1 Tax=Branchiostoma lanceolatum TaxID=7740 RepID=A0A8J9VMJ0_BRALA|nr:Hypp6218 [Branchiostoma lanceolatum]
MERHYSQMQKEMGKKNPKFQVVDQLLSPATSSARTVSAMLRATMKDSKKSRFMPVITANLKTGDKL